MTSKTIGSGYRVKDGKVTKIDGYGLNASAKIKRKKSRKVRVVKKEQRRD